MAAAEPLTLAVREFASWCDLVCRLHRFAPQGDARLWWSARRAPDLVPDAVTLVLDLPALDVLGRIADSPGVSVADSFSTLDLTDQGWTVRFDATWVARPPGTGADGATASTFTVVREKLPFAAWCRASGEASGEASDVLPPGLRRAPGVAVLGRASDDGFVAGAILHHTAVGGTAVTGLWNVFGGWADVATAAAHRHRDAWTTSYARGADLDAALAAGFTAIGPLRLWQRERAGP